MDSPIWQITNSTAEFSCGRFSAVADLGRPMDGLKCIAPSLASAEFVRIFQIRLPDAAAHRLPVADAYVRLSDLIVRYDQTEARPFSVEVCWRGLAGDSDARVQAGVEVVVSVYTSLLDSRPIVSSRSELAAGEVFRLQDADAGAGEFDLLDCDGSDSRLQPFSPQSGVGCFVFRLTGSATSYVEMIHPLDFERATLTAPADQPGRTIEHSLISRWMEKGVIVRSRMRGLFVDRRDDLAAAAAAYAAFCNSKLPLSA